MLMTIEPSKTQFVDSEPVLLSLSVSNASTSKVSIRLGERGVKFLQFIDPKSKQYKQSNRLGRGGLWHDEIIELGPGKSGQRILVLDDWIEVGTGTNIVEWLFDNGQLTIKGKCDLKVESASAKQVYDRLDGLVVRIEGATTRKAREDLVGALGLWLKRSALAREWGAARASQGPADRARLVEEALQSADKVVID